MKGLFKVNIIFPNGKKFRSVQTYRTEQEATMAKLTAEPRATVAGCKVQLQEFCRVCGVPKHAVYLDGKCKKCYKESEQE